MSVAGYQFVQQTVCVSVCLRLSQSVELLFVVVFHVFIFLHRVANQSMNTIDSINRYRLLILLIYFFTCELQRALALCVASITNYCFIN